MRCAFAFAFAVLFLLAAPLRAQEDEEAPQLVPAAQRARAVAERLGLSPGQRRKVENLFRLEEQEEQPLIEKIMERRRRTRLAVRAVLRADQKEGFAGIKEPPLIIGGSAGQSSAGPAPAGDDAHPGVLVDDDSHLPGQDNDDGTGGRPSPPPARLSGQMAPPHPSMGPAERVRRRAAPAPAADDAAGRGPGGRDRVMVDGDTPPADGN